MQDSDQDDSITLHDHAYPVVSQPDAIVAAFAPELSQIPDITETRGRLDFINGLLDSSEQ